MYLFNIALIEFINVYIIIFILVVIVILFRKILIDQLIYYCLS